MARKYQDIAFQAGKYIDREGKERTRYQPGGRLITEDDGRQWGTIEFMGLTQTFSVFDQKPRNDNKQSAVQESSKGARPPIDDDIPF